MIIAWSLHGSLHDRCILRVWVSWILQIRWIRQQLLIAGIGDACTTLFRSSQDLTGAATLWLADATAEAISSRVLDRWSHFAHLAVRTALQFVRRALKQLFDEYLGRRDSLALARVIEWSGGVCMCVCARERARVCVRACARVCVCARVRACACACACV